MMNLRLFVCCTLLPAAVGCQTLDFDLRKNIPWGAGADGELEPPVKLAAMWTDTVLNSSNAPSTRGFGGRLMFYAADNSKPMEVKGTLEVYAFDETDRDPENTRPDRKYVFTPEQFEKHHSKSALGHSYSVWLPWDVAGGPQREISLLVRFTPHKGPIVVGEASKQILPGVTSTDLGQKKKPKTASEAGAATASASGEGGAGAIQPVSYDAAIPGAAVPNGAPPPGAGKRMSTTTISLPQQHPTRPGPYDGGAIWSRNPADAAAGVRTRLPSALPQGASQAWSNSPAAPQAFAAAGGPVAYPESMQATTSAAAGSSPATHFGPQRHRALGAPLARLERGRAPWQHSRLAQPSPPPAGPESVPGGQAASIASVGPPALR
jgi:hypothetical protein